MIFDNQYLKDTDEDCIGLQVEDFMGGSSKVSFKLNLNTLGEGRCSTRH